MCTPFSLALRAAPLYSPPQFVFAAGRAIKAMLDDDAMAAVLSEKLIHLPPDRFDRAVYSTLQAFFVFVGINGGHVQESAAGGHLLGGSHVPGATKSALTTLNLDGMPGLSAMWDLAAACPHEETARDFRRVLVTLHTNLCDALRPRAAEVRAAFAAECARRLEEAAAAIERAGGAHAAPEEALRAARRFAQLLVAALEEDAQQAEPPGAPPPHGMTFRKRDVALTLQQAMRSAPRIHHSLACNHTVGFLRQSILTNLSQGSGGGSPAPESVRLMCSGKMLTADAAPLGQLEGKVVQYSALNHVLPDLSRLSNGAAAATTPREALFRVLLAEGPGAAPLFGTLARLAECPDRRVAVAAQALLQMLPTQPAVRATLERALAAPTAAPAAEAGGEAPAALEARALLEGLLAGKGNGLPSIAYNLQARRAHCHTQRERECTAPLCSAFSPLRIGRGCVSYPCC